jgi:hypothetical protein
VRESHILTVFLWSQKIGHIVGANEDENLFYKSQLAEFKKTDQELNEAEDVPKIIGQFTNWRYQEMVSLLDFCKENDPTPPNLIKELIDNGTLRQAHAN